MGSFAVQLAKAFGTEVTGVCSTSSADLVRSCGADHIIDYARGDFTRTGRCYDLVLDTVGGESLRACRRALEEHGTYVAVGGPTGRWVKGLGRPVRALALSAVVRQRFRPFVMSQNATDLMVLRELIEEGHVRPIIERSYALDHAISAMTRLGRGHARGKVVITVPDVVAGADACSSDPVSAPSPK